MGKISRRAIRFALAASLLSGLLSAAHASASIDQGTYTLVNPEVSVNAGTTEGGYVSCPTGQRIVAQGAFWHLPGQSPDPNNATVTLTGSNSPTIDALGMFSSGSNRSTTTRYRQSVLLCLPSSVIGTPYTTVTGDSAPLVGPAGGYLPCPAGQRVVSGGAFWHLPGQSPDQSLAANSWISSSSPTVDGLGWYADGYSSSGPRVLSTVIHCLPSAGFGPYSIVHPDSAEVGAGSVAGGYVNCPDGQRIVTGGAFWHLKDSAPNSALATNHFLSSSTPTFDAKGWYADGVSGAKAQLQTVLLCVAPRPDTAAGAGLGSKPGKSCGGQRATVVGGPRSETLRGTGDKDVIAGLGGADKLVGLGAKDILCGGAGPDTLKGGGANDRLLGGGGRDVCVGGAGNDKASSCAKERTI